MISMKQRIWTRLMPRAIVVLTVLTFLSGFQLEAADAPPEKVFRAGAAIGNATPPLGELIVGSFSPTPATDVHDPISVRCLLLDNGTTQIAFVVCDNVGISREVFDAAREFIKAETQVPPHNVLMCSTHTHSATTARSKTKSHPIPELVGYQKFLARRIGDVVRLALNRLQPAKIGWGSVDDPSHLFNRRWHVTDPKMRRNPFGGVDTVRMNPPSGSKALVRPAGPIDPQVSFISVRTTDDQPIALLANYSLHYVGGVPRGVISADYFAVFSRRIGELLGADPVSSGFVGIMSNGTSGDVNNINFKNRGPRRKPFEKMTEVAESLAQKVAAAEKSITWHPWVELGAEYTELPLNVRKPDEKMLAYAKEVLSKPDSEPQFHRLEKNYASRIQKIDAGPDQISAPMQALRIGDLGITAIPFEVFTETGLEIKEKSPFDQTFTMELANGSFGYLPTPEQHKLGGYETWLGSNYVQKDASEKISQTVLGLLKKLHDEK